MIVAARYGDRSHVLLARWRSRCRWRSSSLVSQQPRGGAPAISVTLLGVFWIGLALAHAVLLRDLPHGDGIVVDVLVGTFLGDTGAYLGGRAFGATPLAPRISPNKTVEGLVVGIVIGASRRSGSPASTRTGSAAPQALLLGVAVAWPRRSATCSSAISSATPARRTPARLFGAHGGALDRLDAVDVHRRRRVLRLVGDALAARAVCHGSGAAPLTKCRGSERFGTEGEQLGARWWREKRRSCVALATSDRRFARVAPRVGRGRRR